MCEVVSCFDCLCIVFALEYLLTSICLGNHVHLSWFINHSLMDLILWYIVSCYTQKMKVHIIVHIIVHVCFYQSWCFV